MPELDLTAGAAPIFLDGNWLTREADEAGDLVIGNAAMHAQRHRLYDMVPASYAETSGSVEGTPESIIAGLYNGGGQVERDIDFVALLGHNFLGYTLEFSTDNGGSYPQSITGSALAAAYTLRSLSAVQAANKVRLSATNTQAAEAEKRLGVLVLAEARFQAPRGMAAYSPSWEVLEKSARMGDGSLRRAVIGRADAGNRFYRAGMGFRGLTQAQLRTFRSELLDNPEPFLLVPEPGEQPEIVVQCRIVPGSWREGYLSLRRAAGHELSFDVEELGGA